MGVEQIQAEIKALQDRIERYTKTGQDVEPVYIEIQRAERRLAKEEAKLPVHPAYVLSLASSRPVFGIRTVWEYDADYRLVFGPVAQTIAAMSCISLGMSSLHRFFVCTITRLNNELTHPILILVLINLFTDNQGCQSPTFHTRCTPSTAFSPP